MSNVTIIGGGGYAGSHIAEAAAVQGLVVTSMARSEIAEQIAGVKYRIGSILNQQDRGVALREVDTVVVAVSPRGDMAGKLRPAIAALATEADSAGVRLFVVGGAGSLIAGDGVTLVKDSPDFPVSARAEADEMAGVLEDLRATPESLNWSFVSPAAIFGVHARGEYRGEYRVGGDQLLVDEQGISAISGADFGMAVVDELEYPEHLRQRFTVAY